MKAVIMAGGFGTRLRPLTCNIPKPMVPIANAPIMNHIVALLKTHGFNDIVSLLYYHPSVIRNHFGDGHDFGIQMQYMQAEADFGTAGSVRNASEKFGDERLLIISGDILTDFDLTAALNFHIEKKADATVVLTRVPNPLQFGVIIVDETGMITRFLEKPSWGEVFSDTINTGIYIFENYVLQMIPYKEEFDFSKNLFPLMMQEGMTLCGYIAEGYWRDVGTLNEYQEASMDCLFGNVNVQLPGTRNGNVFIGEGSEVHDMDGNFAGTVVVGNNSRIGGSTKIINSIIGNNVTIFGGSVIQNSVIWDGCTIEENVHISSGVIGFDSLVRSGATIAENVFISDRCYIGQNAQLLSNIKLWPEKVVQDGAVLSKSLVWEDKWMRELFTDARITGTTNIEINPEFAAKLGAAVGAVLGEGRTMLASRDPDTASRMIKRALVCGLMSAGVLVYDMQTSSIPMVRQELRNARYAAGFYVRKSPFDKRAIDIIFLDGDGKDMTGGKTKNIERQFFSEDFKRAEYFSIGSLHFPERTTEHYRGRFFSTLDTQSIAAKKFNIVIDYSYGIASSIFPNILGDMGAQVVTLNAYIDPAKLTRSAAEFQDACEHISNIVKSLSADVGFLIDAGAEKTFVADENGNFISDDRLLTIVTKLYLETQKIRGKEVKKIACPVSATSEVDIVAAEYGVEVVRTTTTHGGMMNIVFDDPEVGFVGGTKGGFIFPEFSFAADAMYSNVKILEMMAVTGRKLGEIDYRLERLYRTERDIQCNWDLKGRVMRHAMNESSNMQRELIDGIKIISDERNWVLLLPSKEFSTFHILVESDSHDHAHKLANEYEAKVVQWRDNP